MKKWILTTTAAAAVLLLITGWGSAIASTLSTAVVVKNTATNPVVVKTQGAVTVANPVSTVSVSNFPAAVAAPKTSVIASSADTVLPANFATTLLSRTDTSAYAQVTLYIKPVGLGGTCVVSELAGAVTLDAGEPSFGNTTTVMTIKDPVNIQVDCQNDNGTAAHLAWALVGRTG